MKKTFLAITALAAMLFAGCTSSDELTTLESIKTADNTPTPVQFGTYMGKTRAATTTAKNYSSGPIGNNDDNNNNVKELAKARFGVFGYYTGSKNYRGAYNSWGTDTWKNDDASKYPNFMYNQELMYSTASPTNEWIYSPVKYWPNGNDAATTSTDATNPSGSAVQNAEAKLSFFAYAPYMLEGTTTTGGTKPASVTAKNVSTPLQVDTDGDSTPETDNGIVAISDNNSPTNVWLKYVMPIATEDKAVDLLWGIRGQATYNEADGSNNTVSLSNTEYNTDLTKQKTAERVKFLFKHALAKIGGATASATENIANQPTKCGLKVVVDIDKNSDSPKTTGQSNQTTYFENDFSNTTTLVTIKEVKIRDLASVVADADVTGITSGTSNISSSAWFDIESGTWAEQTGAATYKVVANNTSGNDGNTTDTNYSLNVKIKEIGAQKNGAGSTGKELLSGNAAWDGSANPIGVTTTPTDVFPDENVPALMLIPGPNAQDIYITVEYVVRTADPKLAAGFSEVTQKITNKVSLASLTYNKHYTIVMHLGLTSVKFSATVSDWDAHDDNDNQVIWLPSNVVG